MIRTFTKGKLKKELLYARLLPRQCNAWTHVVSMHGSDRAGRIRIERERYEEFANEHQAKACFRRWAAELIGEGWEWLEGIEVEARDKSEASSDKPTSWDSFTPKEECEKRVKGQPRNFRHMGTCAKCGKTFTPTAGSQKFCSKECRLEAANEGKFVHEIRKCETCGAEFVAQSGKHRYCSRKCKEAARTIRRRETVAEPRKCEWCGTEFTAQRKGQRYCSKKCCVAACSRRHWEKIKQKRKK